MGTHGMRRTPVPARRARTAAGAGEGGGNALATDPEAWPQWGPGFCGSLHQLPKSPSLPTHTNSNSFSFHRDLCFPVVVITVTKSSTVMLSTCVLSVFTSLSFPPIFAAALEGVTNTKPILQVSKLRLSFTNRGSHLPKVTQLSSDRDRNRSQI